MCTVSVIRAPWFGNEPDGLGWRVVFNRDERRTRHIAFGPRHVDLGGIHAVFPVDADAGGTWIAASSAGLVYALLNDTAVDGSLRHPRVSRGCVIPSVLPAQHLQDAVNRIGRLSLDRYAPFRLLVLSSRALFEARWNGTNLTTAEHQPQPTFVRTSSSLDPDETTRRRTALFGRLVPRPSVAAQDAYHLHRWRLAPAASVLMTRPDARTVSVTTVEVFARNFRLAYRPFPDGRADVTELAMAA